MSEKQNGVKTETWVAWIGASVAAMAAGVFLAVTFAYAQFETKEHAKENHDAVLDRLNRIENKIDVVVERGYGRQPGGR